MKGISLTVKKYSKAYSIPRFLLHPLSIIIIVSISSVLLNLYLYSDGWEEAHTIYASGIISFAIGCMYIAAIGLFLNKKSPKPNWHPPANNKKVIIFYWMLSIIGAFIGFYIFITRGVMIPGDLFFNLRYAHTIDHQSTLGARYFSLFALAIAIFYAQYDDKLKTIIAATLFLFVSLVFAERTSILLLFVILTYTYAWKRKIGFVHVILAGFIFLLISTIVAFSSRKMGVQGEFYALKYFGYSLTSFQDYILLQQPYKCPRIIFGNVIGAALESLGFNSCDGPSQFVKPGMFNVYTYAANPYLFGGQMAVIISMFVLGQFYSIFYSMAERKEGYALAVLSCFIYPVVMVFFAWQFSLTTYLYMAIILAPLFYDIRIFGTYRNLHCRANT